MLLPLSWLKDFVDLDGISPDELETRLFESGFEVEEKKYLGEEIKNCVVGQIKSITKHPDSTHLQICILDCGKFGQEIQIVTGAQNVFEGAKVPVALDGAHLAGGVKIKKGKLRGVESNGMLCSGGELGITEDFFPNAGVDGIMILPDSVPIGANINNIVGLDDWVFDISITANRPDSENIFGMAREVSAIFARRLKQPQIIFNTHENLELALNVVVEDAENCPKYMATVVDNVRVEPSPVWLRQRLIKCGVNPINNVVDITNYVLLELGQPMHAFDYHKIGGKTLTVRRAKTGETLKTLDDATKTLAENNLVIADNNTPLALAGIMGGTESSVQNQTKTVALESAKFLRECVRKTSRGLGIASNSSHRFEKGIDQFTVDLAMSRALNLFETLGAGQVTTCQKSFEAKPYNNSIISTSTEKINKILGIDVPAQEIVSILVRLGFDVVEKDGTLDVTAPLFRTDIDGTADLAEEIIRIYGYKHIKPKLLADTGITKGGLSPVQLQNLRAKRTLAGLGFNEIVTYSFGSEKHLNMLKLPSNAPERNFVRLQNPLSEDIAVMKTTLVPGMLEIMTANYKKGVESGKFFELANIYFPKEHPIVNLPLETKTLCLGVWGEKEDFFTLKGYLENFAEVFGLKFDFEPCTKPFLHPFRAGNILLDGTVVGCLGQVAYDITKQLSTTASTFVVELNFDEVSKHFASGYQYQAVSKYPDIKRDLAVVVQENITSQQVERAMRSASKKIAEITLFDVYAGNQLAEGFKSLAYTLVFRSGEEAITHEEVDAQIKKILKNLHETLGATLRA